MRRKTGGRNSGEESAIFESIVEAESAGMHDLVSPHMRRFGAVDREVARGIDAERRRESERRYDRQREIITKNDHIVAAIEFVFLYWIVWHKPPGRTGDWFFPHFAVTLVTTAALVATLYYMGGVINGLFRRRIEGVVGAFLCAGLLYINFTVYTQFGSGSFFSDFVDFGSGIASTFDKVLWIVVSTGTIFSLWAAIQKMIPMPDEPPSIVAVVVSGYVLAFLETGWSGAQWDPFNLVIVSTADYFRASVHDYAWIPAALAFISAGLGFAYPWLSERRALVAARSGRRRK